MKNILLKFIKLILIFINIAKKVQVHKNGSKYILFRIDVYFNKLLVAVEIDEKGPLTEMLFLKKKDKTPRKKTWL